MAALCSLRVSLPPLNSFQASTRRPHAPWRRSQLRVSCVGVGSRRVSFRPLDREELEPGLVVDVPRSVPVRVAHELLQAGHHFLDVRTPAEFSGGHAVGATNVPYMLNFGIGFARNPNFVDEVLSVFGKDAEIIVGCQSGKRSLMAATDLASAGFTGITDIAGGYSAWTQNGLPIVME